jgi:hypothetical protein
MNDLAGELFQQEQRLGRCRCSGKEISDEAGVCSRRSCGNHDPDIACRVIWPKRGRLIGRQQQR